jgi:general stress protein 26
MTQNLAVLATQHQGQPYSSLMAFVATEDLKDLYVGTSRSTRKYSYLTSESRVSLLIDNRSNRDADLHEAVAVTAIGNAQEMVESDKEQFLPYYLSKHPHLQDFIKAPSCALIRIAVKAYYLVIRFQQVMELHIGS